MATLRFLDVALKRRNCRVNALVLTAYSETYTILKFDCILRERQRSFELETLPSENVYMLENLQKPVYTLLSS